VISDHFLNAIRLRDVFYLRENTFNDVVCTQPGRDVEPVSQIVDSLLLRTITEITQL
jgi:hypothetical protein